VVRAESTDFRGEQNFAGAISVGTEDQARLASSDTSSQLTAAHADRQRLADELAIAQGQLVERDARLASLRHQLDRSLAAQSETQQAASEMSARLAAEERDRQRLADELAIAQGQLVERDTSLATLRDQLDRNFAAQSENDRAASDMSARIAAAERDRQRLADELAVAQGQLAERDTSLASLRHELDQNKLANAERHLLEALQPEISKGTVLVQQTGDVLTINLASGLLFDSGQDRMKAGASNALKRVGTVLRDFPDKQVHVAGYTDNVAIKGGLQKKFLSNKELSEARANRAAKALRDGGVSANLWTDGYGESNPIAPNTTANGRAKNRRVEIIVG
jgi:chemotaxis protein MotB